MTRLFEFLVALVIVAVLGLVVGVVMPGEGHVERTMLISKDLRQVYDVFGNFRRFPDYSVLRAYDHNIQFDFSGKAYGPGAKISWVSKDPKVGDGTLEIASMTPSATDVSDQGKGEIVWNIDNAWRGSNKRFTIDMERSGHSQKLVKVTWSYDVSYGWNLIDRYSSLYIHGDPDSMIQFSLGNLQNVLASIPNVDYSKLNPELVDRPAQPILFVSTSAQRTLDDVDTASDKAMAEIDAAMKKLGVKAVGPRTTFTTNWGDQTYSFDIAVPIDSSTLHIDGKDYELTAATRPQLDASAPAAAGTAAAPAEAGAAASDAPGSKDRFGRLIIDGNVRAVLAFGGRALKASWTGTGAGLPLTRQSLQAYSLTHGYKFDDVTYPLYDIQIKAPTTDHGTVSGYEDQQFDVYLPLTSTNLPAQTSEQEAGLKPDAAAPAAAASTAAPAEAASTAK